MEQGLFEPGYYTLAGHTNNPRTVQEALMRSAWGSARPLSPSASI